MSKSFTKLFSSITESTVWCEPHSTRIAWITMLAMADRKGRVWASIPGLANRARVSLEETEAALTIFLAPDRYSRTEDHEGRRLERIDGGWRLLNYDKYRAIMDENTIAENNRKAQVKFREKHKNNEDAITVMSGNERSLQAEAEAEAEKIYVDDPVDYALSGDPSSKVNPVDTLVEAGWFYWLDQTARHASQNKLTKDKLVMGRRGFESLIDFAREREASQPREAATELFKAAVNRMAASQFHNGSNAQGEKYNNWHNLFSGKGYPSPRKLLEFWLDDSRWPA